MHNFEDMTPNGNYTCRVCNGHKVVQEFMEELKCVCDHCHGQGTVDWVTHVMNKKTPFKDSDDVRQLRYNIAMRNITCLMQEIKRQGHAIDIDVDVTIEKRPRRNFMEEYMSNPMPPLLMPDNTSLAKIPK